MKTKTKKRPAVAYSAEEMARFAEAKKKDAVRAIRKHGVSLPDASRRFGVTLETLQKWLSEDDGLDEISTPRAKPLSEAEVDERVAAMEDADLVESSPLRNLGSPVTIPLPGSPPPVEKLTEFDAVAAIYRTLESFEPPARKRVQRGVSALLEALNADAEEEPVVRVPKRSRFSGIEAAEPRAEEPAA